MNKSLIKNKLLLFIIFLIFYSIFYLYWKRNGGLNWSISEWLINYQGGFTRRGLGGELNIFLENLPEDKPEIKEAYRFTMTLPDTYYGIGSYDKWIKTGFALKNTNIYLLIVWLKFSSQSSTFNYNTKMGVSLSERSRETFFGRIN